MKNVLVTGGAGYIGSHAVQALIAGGYAVTVIDNLSKGHRQAVHPQAKFIELDLADQKGLEQVFSDGSFDAVMHFAGSIEVALSMREPAQFFQNNCVNGVDLLEAMRKAGVKNIIFSSTAAVYGNPKKVPIKETALLKPTNFYGQSKLIFEQLLQQYEQMFGFRFVALRYFNAAGAASSGQIGQDYEPSTHLIPRVLKAALGQITDLKVFGNDYPTQDGTCIRDYIHVTDLVDAHVLALEYLFKKKRSSVFNLGNGQGFSVLHVLHLAQKMTGRKIPYRFGERRQGDPAVLVADSSKAKKILTWQPRLYRLEDIIKTAWQWHLNHPKGYAVR